MQPGYLPSDFKSRPGLPAGTIHQRDPDTDKLIEFKRQGIPSYQIEQEDPTWPRKGEKRSEQIF